MNCYSPNADLLILVGKMGATLEVITHDSSSCRPKIVLGAAFGSKIVKITRVLGDLDLGGEMVCIIIAGLEINWINCKEQFK